MVTINVHSSHTVIPSDPTPTGIFPLSLCDQIKLPSHGSFLLVYTHSNNDTPISISSLTHTLKTSLAKTLTHYYPLSARLSRIHGGRFQLLCFSQGATLLEATCDAKLESLGDFAPTQIVVENLVPKFDPDVVRIEDMPLLAAQVTRFSCGGVTVGMALCRVINDGEAVSRFMMSWGKVARGEEMGGGEIPCVDRSVLDWYKGKRKKKNREGGFGHFEFLPQPVWEGRLVETKGGTKAVILKVTRGQVQKLKSKVRDFGSFTSFEVIAGHLWRCVSKVRHVGNGGQPTRLSTLVNCRRRLNPPLRSDYFGNATFPTVTTPPCCFNDVTEKPLGFVVGKVREAIEKMDDEYVRSALDYIDGQKDLNVLRDTFHASSSPLGNPNLFLVGWTNFPFFEFDFGWGKPVFLGPGQLKDDGKAFVMNDGGDGFNVAICLHSCHVDALKESNPPEFKEYTLQVRYNSTLEVCFDKQVSYGSGNWLENSLAITIPLFVLQFAIILAFNRICILAAAPLHLPRIVTDLIAGLLIGPFALGRSIYTVRHIFTFSSLMALETVAALTLVYYMFLIGLEMDLKPITRSGNKRAVIVAIVNILFSLPVGFGLYYLFLTNLGSKPMPVPTGMPHYQGALLWGITLSCSEFPEIAKILANLKLVLNENGQLALTSALTTDLFSWIFLIIAITAFHSGSVLSVLSTFIFLLICFFLIHPLAKWLFHKIGTNKDRDFAEDQVFFLLHMVLLFGLLTDGLGAHSITGAYVLGAITPKGAITSAIQDKVLDFVTAFMMPIYFAVVGQRIHMEDLALNIDWTTIVVILLLAFVAKILSTFLVCMFYRMPPMEGLSLGLLMNTKGVVAIIVLTNARDMLALNNQTFAVMILACWLMTLPVGPILAATNKLTTTSMEISLRRTMQGARPDIPLRVLACVHTSRDAAVITNLLKASNPTVKSPIQVFAVELVKMTSRPTTALIMDDSHSSSNHYSNNNYHNKQIAESKSKKNLLRMFDLEKSTDTEENILDSFNNLNQAIFAEKLRVVSDYNTMHKDIFHLAKQRGVTLILTTFYKQPTYDGLGAGTATARAANIVNRECSNMNRTKVVIENLVQEPPCCLGIFIDRGLGQKQGKEIKIAMFYVGGADDREALAYAWRMCRSQDTELTVVRLVWDNPSDAFDQTDEEYIRLFRFQTRDKGDLVKYMEAVVRDEKETIALLNKIGNLGFDLYVVGRGQGRRMSLAQTLDPVLEEPALGPLGDTLADLNSAAETSILILETQDGGSSGNDSSKEVTFEYAYFEGHGDLMLRGGHMTWRASEING
ncbi:cation/H(+) antiporter 15-like [Senna tora]|uniref:Cation/H(+) antiporter 15-like n=1 Tax=Senna tora TaxID=362788 RepID=A0A834SEA4_9FABA|nr:cation/H(+) antiporter 15-like [Senna tora]